MPRTRVLLVDDHALVRAGIRGLIDQLSDFIVVDEASNIADAMDKIEQIGPDLIVTDISMGAENGLDLLRATKKKYPEILVAVLSMHATEELVAEALELGAAAYLLKEAAPEELGLALRAMMGGEVYLGPALSKKMIAWFVRPPSVPQHSLQVLTARQIQILTLIASGKATKEIAFELGLSDKTIAAHRAQIMERLGVKDRAGLVSFAVKHGLVDLST
jgi:DNA-binding NarL/FixJ family response regulator